MTRKKNTERVSPDELTSRLLAMRREERELAWKKLSARTRFCVRWALECEMSSSTGLRMLGTFMGVL